MGLTRTRFSQANTIVARIQDPITVLNSESTVANVDVGFLINRDLGSSSNVALFWKESSDEFVTALTANAGLTDSNITVTSYANLRVGTFFGNIGGGNSQANTYISGSLIPSANVAYDLGTNGRRFRDLWLSGTTLHMGDQRLTVTNGEWRFTTPTTTVVLGAESTVGNLTVTGNLNLQGSSTTFDSNSLSIQDSIIELHTLANLAPLTGDDGRDIGLKFHYYKTKDEHAFLGWSNSTGYLEWYDSGREGVGNVFTGNTFGTIKSGGAILANTTPSTSTTTGALRVSGGVGIAGNLYITNTGDVSANIGTIKTNLGQLDANVGAYQTYANANAVAQAGSISSLTSNAATQHIAITSLDANVGNITTQLGSITSGANANTAAYLLTATGNIAAGNLTVTGNIYGGIVPTAIYKSVYVGSTLVNLARGTGALTVNDFNTTGYAAQANLATLATNATKTTVTSNISSGTAYVTFVNATTGNVDQNINTALTYNPNSGNLTAYGLITTTGIFWANGTPFASSSYGNTDVASYLPVYSGTINATLSQSNQPNITDIGTLVNLDVSGATYLTGFVTMDGTGGGTPQYSVKMGNADGEKLAVATRGTAGYGIGLETLNDAESGYGKLNVTASEIHFNIKNGSAATVQNNAIVVQANGMVTLDSTTVSTSTTTGALVVSGGVGIAGNVYADKFYTTNGLYWAGNGLAFSSGSTYSNANVEAYIGGNIGAYQTYANANAATQATSINTFNANLGAFQIFSNANAASQATSIDTFNANLGAYQIYANANAATQATSINSIDANLGTATTNITTLFSNAASQAISITSLATGANANTAAYLPSVTTLAGLTSFGAAAATTTAQGSLTIVGNLTVQGNTLTIGSNNLTVTDSIIDLHTFANLAPLTSNDGRDIGIRLHYYKTSDKHAFLGWENATEALTYYQDATETNGIVTGTLGNVELGSLYVSNTTPSTSTTTGALVVRGGMGVAGNIQAGNITVTGNVTGTTFIFANGVNILSTISAGSTYSNVNVEAYIGGNIGAFQIFSNANAATQATSINTINANIGAFQIFSNSNAATQATSINTINANIGAFYTYANTKIGTNTNSNLVVVATTTSTSTTTGALVVRGGSGIAGDAYIGGLLNVGTGASSSLTGAGALTINASSGVTINPGSTTDGTGPSTFIYGGSDDGLGLAGHIYLRPGTTGGSSGDGNIYLQNPYGTTLVQVTTSPINVNLSAGTGGPLIVTGGARTTGNLYVGGAARIVSANTSTSTTTGALVVGGGVGVAGNVYANAIYTTTGIRWAGNGVAFSSGGGGGTFTASNTAPTSPNAGDQWYYVASDILFEYINDGDSNQWVDTSSPTTPTSTVVSDLVLSNVSISSVYNVNNTKTALGVLPTVATTPPSSPIRGDLWYNTTEDILYQYLYDGTSNYWVDVSSSDFGYASNASSLLNTTIQGNLVPATNATYDIGTNATRFRDIWASGNITATGNITSANVTTGNITATGNIAAGNVTITSNLSVTQSGVFRGPYDENSIVSGVFVGNTGSGVSITPRVGFFNGNTQQNWQIDNNLGEFRWFVPGAAKMSLYSTGNLNVTGGYTVGGKKAVNGPAFRAYIAVAQTIVGNGTQQRVTFGSETFDTDNNFTSSRFTPTVEGYYQLNSTVRIAGTAGTGENMLVIYKNGGEYARGTNGSGTEIGANFYSMQVSDIAYANGTGDYFEVFIQQGSGANRDTTAGTNISYFSGCMIRGA